METALSIAIGLGLAAAAGFRVFVPLLIACVASRTGHLPLTSGFDWLSTNPALIILATATLVEIIAYSVPWLDHVLDLVATPAAVLAGVLASAAVMTEMPPYLKWSLAIIAGGGAVGIVQGATVLARLKSTLATGGLANPLVALAEFSGSVLTAVLAIAVPLFALLCIGGLCLMVFLVSHRFLFGRRKRA